MVTVSREHIEIVQGAGGPKARIAGSRTRVADIVLFHETHGMTVDEIVDQFPFITRADVYASLAYYWDHKQEVDDHVSAEEAYAEEFFRTYGPGLLAEKLRQRQLQNESPSLTP